MRVENSPAHAALAHTLAVRTAARAPAEQVTTPDTGTPKTDPAETAKAPPVTGVSRSTLSKEILDQAIRTQETVAPETDKYEGILDDIDRRYLERIANDPKAAAERAEFFGTAPRAIFIPFSEIGINSLDDLNHNPEAQRKFQALLLRMNRIQQQEIDRKQLFYERRVADNVPPAQIYADILKFYADNSELNAIQDSGGGAPEGHTTRYLQAKADYLQSLIDRKAETA